MKFWPVPNSKSDSIPKKGDFGFFWEERDEGFNAGIDIFAEENSNVYAIEDGIIIDIDKFSENDESGSNETFYIVIRGSDKINYKYCEILPNSIKIGQKINSGDHLGVISSVYKEENLNSETPIYIREQISEGKSSKLHLELYKAPFSEVRPYKMGNYLGENKPKSLLNPQIFLSNLKKKTT